ncbi:unnamed protein product [Pseudo-nitzschia multistriata]|uniref:Leucine-rich repeat-containing N-terminal plant-type domain-containing protein n=1 Tax=Pseudo-nitzschia multistriata TaxID=183589 RepID=A0A448Z3M8_9STRA|nr:unnamed protein product [Pseudo-nitzschia multistriata]
MISLANNWHPENPGISGSLPSEIMGLSSLNAMFLQANGITGSLPVDFGRLSSLKTFVAVRNRLTGRIPSSLALIPDLGTFIAAYNFLTGTIPSELGLIKTGINRTLLISKCPSSFSPRSAVHSVGFWVGFW